MLRTRMIVSLRRTLLRRRGAIGTIAWIGRSSASAGTCALPAKRRNKRLRKSSPRPRHRRRSPAPSIATPVAAAPVGAANSATPGDGAASLPRVKMLSVKRQPAPMISATTNEPAHAETRRTEVPRPRFRRRSCRRKTQRRPAFGRQRRRRRPRRCGPILRSRLLRPRRGIRSQFQTMPAMARFDVRPTL